MCGIGGVINFEAKSHLSESEWFSFLRHRGPDSQNSWYNNNSQYFLGFYHSRLAIRDLSETGNQPMVSSSGRSVIVYNGELYNAEFLSAKLLGKIDIAFRGTSDTELILEYIEYFGINEFCNDADGMFAIGYFDKQTESLSLLTDDYGQKPIYFLNSKNGFVFSSVYQNVLPFLEEIAFDSDILYQTINFGFNSERKTPVTGISKLRSREILNFKKGYLSINSREIESVVKPLNYNDLTKAIEMTTISDKEIAVFRSSGIDSNLVYNTLKSKYKLKSFTVSFAEGYDEFLDLDDHSSTEKLIISKDHYSSFFDEFQIINSELFIDSSVVALCYLAKHTKDYVDVVLTGDGGDEMFFGYRRHILLSFVPKFLRKGIILRILYTLFLAKYKFNTIIKVPRILFGDARDYDVEYFLPKVLTKVDFATMENSLESRAPLLTRQILKVARSASLENQKFTRLKGKSFLRHSPFLKNSELQGKSKRGFTPGIDAAMIDLMDSNFILQPELHKFFKSSKISTSRYDSEQLWGIYYTNEWIKRIKEEYVKFKSSI